MKLVTFDLDGVLMRNPFNRYVFPKIAELLRPYLAADQEFHPPVDAQGQLLSPLPDQITAPGLDAEERVIVAAILAETVGPLQAGFSPAAFDWDAAVGNVAEKVGYKKKISIVELVKEGCRLGYAAAYPHAATTLEILCRAGATLVAITNGFTCYQKPVLQTLGLLRYFRAVVTPVEAGVAKPATRIFAMARRMVGLPDDQPAIHVGDSILCDVVGANAAGMYAIWVNDTLPTTVRAAAAWERPVHPELMPHLYKVMRREFAYPVYQPPPQQLMPAAVVSGMMEIPTAITHLWRTLMSDAAQTH
ncbi:MAG TPA: HAD family hydrolase [Firmicutes bacterium]|nr:HAD family hydrolase [Bacillota bacterium]